MPCEALWLCSCRPSRRSFFLCRSFLSGCHNSVFSLSVIFLTSRRRSFECLFRLPAALGLIVRHKSSESSESKMPFDVNKYHCCLSPKATPRRRPCRCLCTGLCTCPYTSGHHMLLAIHCIVANHCMCLDMFIDMCMDMCLDMCIDMCTDMCIDVCLDI